MSDGFKAERHLGKDYQILPMHKISGGIYGKPGIPLSINTLSQYSLGVAKGNRQKFYHIAKCNGTKQHDHHTKCKLWCSPLLHRMLTSGQIDLMLNFGIQCRASALALKIFCP